MCDGALVMAEQYRKHPASGLVEWNSEEEDAGVLLPAQKRPSKCRCDEFSDAQSNESLALVVTRLGIASNCEMC